MPETGWLSQMSLAPPKGMFMITLPVPLSTNEFGSAPAELLPSKFACWKVVPAVRVTGPLPQPLRLPMVKVPLLTVVPPL